MRHLDTAYVKAKAEEQPLIAACVADEVQPLDAACVKAEEQPLEAADLVRMEARVNDLDRQIASAMLNCENRAAWESELRALQAEELYLEGLLQEKAAAVSKGNHGGRRRRRRS